MLKKELKLLTLLPILLAANLASAGQAEICYTVPVLYETYPQPTNATVFNCPQSGSKTIPQLAALGWEVVQLFAQACNASGGAGVTHIFGQLVIQKE